MSDWNTYQQQTMRRIEEKLDRILAMLSTTAKVKVKQTDEEWLADLKRQYHWVQWDNELVKMQAWLANNKGRQMTRPFILNWLNKIPAPVQVSVKVNHPVYNRPVVPRVQGEKPPQEVIEKLGLKNWGRMP